MTPAPWKILVVDDAPEVHAVTSLALESFEYQGRALQILDAGSSAEARQLLERHPDIAVAVIDVVMETHDAGLDLVHWIRKVQGNHLVRLVVRTGQAGEFPAHEVIVHYEINDYWEKADITLRKLQTSLLTCLRGYSDLLLLHQRTLQLEKWADGMPELLAVREWNDLLDRIMSRLRELFPDRKLDAFLCRNEGAQWPMSSGTGAFPAEGAPDVLPWIDEAQVQVLLDAWNGHTLAEGPNELALYFQVTNGEAWLFFLSLGRAWTDYERHVSRMVLLNFRTLVDNRSLITELEHHRTELDAALIEKDGLLRDHHHRFQTSLQVVLSFMDIESSEADTVSGRTVLQGTRRRLQVMSTLHELLLTTGRSQGLDFRVWLKVFVENEKRLSHRSSTVDTWGVPVPVDLNLAIPLALAVMEMVDLVWAPAYRQAGQVEADIQLTDAPRRIQLKARGVLLPALADRDSLPLEWQMLRQLEGQVGGRIDLTETSISLTF